MSHYMSTIDHWTKEETIPWQVDTNFEFYADLFGCEATLFSVLVFSRTALSRLNRRDLSDDKCRTDFPQSAQIGKYFSRSTVDSPETLAFQRCCARNTCKFKVQKWPFGKSVCQEVAMD